MCQMREEHRCHTWVHRRAAWVAAARVFVRPRFYATTELTRLVDVWMNKNNKKKNINDNNHKKILAIPRIPKKMVANRSISKKMLASHRIPKNIRE